MASMKEFGIALRRLLVVAIGTSIMGCGTTAPMGQTEDGTTTETTDTDTGTDSSTTTTETTYESAGGTSDLYIGSADNGSAKLASFDPGAFVQTSDTGESDGSVSVAEFDDPPPPPPPDDSTAPPPDDPPPPPDDSTAPPPDDGTALPPPDDGAPPPDDGAALPPPDDGTAPPPPDGEFDEFFDPNAPPPDGEFDEFFDPNEPPPDDGFFFQPPADFDGELPPPPDDFEFQEGFILPEDFDGAFSIPPPPGGFEGDGGFFAPPEGFDTDGIFFLPPEGFEGDAVFLPPPPPDFDGDGFFFPASDEFGALPGFEAPPDFFEVYSDFPPPPPGFEGDWQPPPPTEWDGSSGWEPPPADDLYADGEWYPPPPPPGWEGEWFPPPPPPEGLEEFPGDFFFSADFDEFFTPDFFGAQGFEQGPPPFEDFPFGDFLENHSIADIIPGVPPEFVHGVFGEFAFGQLPPPPPGFPPFPAFPEFIEGAGGFGSAFGPPPLPGEFPADGELGPQNLPPEFFEFADQVENLDAFLADLEFLPPPGEGPFDGEPTAGLAGVPFEDIADLLPDDFLLPAAVAEVFETFGHDHPLIGAGGVVNPDLEEAMHDHPPQPEGFDDFDFQGDCPQFDDLFTVYDEENVGEPIRGQINTTNTEVLDDGTVIHTVETNMVETVLGEATPLVEMEPGVFQTQWVVNIRQVTNSVVRHANADDPAMDGQFEQSCERLSQMIWTMLIREVDTNGDGVPDETQVSGSNVVEMLSEIIEGDPTPGLPPLPPPPPLLLPFDFQGVLGTNPEP